MLFTATATRATLLSINAFAVRPSAFGKVAVATTSASTLMSLSFRPPLVRGASTNYENDGKNDDNNNHDDNSMAFGGLKNKKLTEAATVLVIEKLQLNMTKGLIEIKNEVGVIKNEVGVIKNEVVAVKNEFNGQLVEIKNEIVKMDEKFVKMDEKFVKMDGKFVKMDEKINSLQIGAVVGFCAVLASVIGVVAPILLNK